MYQLFLTDTSGVSEVYVAERLKNALDCEGDLAFHIIADVEEHGEAPCFVGELEACKTIQEILERDLIPSKVVKLQ